MTAPATSRLRSLLPGVLTAVALGLILGDRLLFHTAPAAAGEYHRAVADAAGNLPTFIGNWLGTDTPVPPSAIKLLHPNVILARRYTNVTTGRSITFLLVQCHDARDLVGHYPPICYVNQGWKLDAATRGTWSTEGFDVHATQYRFTAERIGQMSSLAIDNFMVLPTGQTCPDMGGIYESAKDPRKKFFGAAQIQFVADADMPVMDRQDFERDLLRAARPLFDRIRAGVRP